MKKTTLYPLLASVLVISLSSGCNIYSPIDDPTTQEQVLSHARACFDDGDLDCAREEYKKVSTGPYADQANSELAFAILDDAGATMGTFLKAIRNDKNINLGGALTSMSNALGAGSLARRKNILEAYKMVDDIGDHDLKALVRFTSSFALVAEMLAEVSQKKGSLMMTDVADNVETCKSVAASCQANCGSTNAKFVNSAAISPNPLVASPISVTAASITADTVTTGMLNAALAALSASLNDLGAKGKWASAVDFVNKIPLDDANQNCYRYALLDQGVGN